MTGIATYMANLKTCAGSASVRAVHQLLDPIKGAVILTSKLPTAIPGSSTDTDCDLQPLMAREF